MLHKFFILAAILAAISSVFAGNNANIFNPTARSTYRRGQTIHVKWSLPKDAPGGTVTVLLVEGEANVNVSPFDTTFKYNAYIGDVDYLQGHIEYSLPGDIFLSYPTYRIVIIHLEDRNNWSFSPAFVIKEQETTPTHAPLPSAT